MGSNDAVALNSIHTARSAAQRRAAPRGAAQLRAALL